MDEQRSAGQGQACVFNELGFFAGLAEDYLQALQALQTLESDSLHYPAAETIYQANTPASCFYVLREGHIKLSKTTLNGKEQIIKIVRPGEIFGFDGFVDQLYNQTAVTLRPVKVCRIPVEQLRSLRCYRHEVERLIMVSCIRELHYADNRLLELGAKRSGERLASFLLSWCEGVTPGAGTPLILSRLEIAQLLGLTIETVSRLFAQWKRQGLIREQNQTIQILDSRYLRRLAFSS